MARRKSKKEVTQVEEVQGTPEVVENKSIPMEEAQVPNEVEAEVEEVKPEVKVVNKEDAFKKKMDIYKVKANYIALENLAEGSYFQGAIKTVEAGKVAIESGDLSDDKVEYWKTMIKRSMKCLKALDGES